MAYSRVEVYWFNRVGDLFQGANNLESSVEGNGLDFTYYEGLLI